MGGPETWFELAELLDDEVFKDMLVQYGEFYFLPVEQYVDQSGPLLA